MYAFKLIIPGILIVSSAFLSYITLMSIKTLLIKTKHDFSHLPAFYELRVSRGTVLIFVVIFILLLFVKQSKIYAALVNINLILYSVFIFIGVSVIDFFARRTRVPGIIRTIIYFPIFIILSVVGLLLPFLHPFNFLIIVSVTDCVFDFRKLRARGEKDGK
jgi:uncharacterized protein YybS (DUF2232 family)